MNRIRRIRRLAAVLAGLAGALLALAAAAPAALAGPVAPVPPGWHQHPPPGHAVPAAAFGGMPGWQIALIAAGTALLAPAVAVLRDRAPAARRTPATAAAAALHVAQVTPLTSRPGAPGQPETPIPAEPSMEARLMFLACPACLGRDGAERCGLPAGVRCRFLMGSADGPLDSAMIRCLAGHWFNAPVASLTPTPGPARAALPCPADTGGRRKRRPP